jgi:hypothetical protein
VGAYGVSKAGLLGLTRIAALEGSARGVAVNAVVPFARTRVTDSIPGGTPERDHYLQSARRARPEDLLPLFDYLVNHAPREVSGQLFCARGRSIHLMSQPRPVASVTFDENADAAAVARLIEDQLLPSRVPLETEFQFFSPLPVQGAQAS